MRAIIGRLGSNRIAVVLLPLYTCSKQPASGSSPPMRFPSTGEVALQVSIFREATGKTDEPRLIRRVEVLVPSGALVADARLGIDFPPRLLRVMW
jgi:hypothetical protein